MKKVKKFLSVLCAACMAITLLPSAMAADLPSEPNVYRLISAQEFNSIAFSILSAPATESYNVQLYHGTASSGGIPVYLYAKDVPIGSGVWFSNLIVGDTYFFKVSSSTAPVPGSNARYSYKTFSFPTITVSTDVAVDIKN